MKSEISQSPKDKYCEIPLRRGIQSSPIHRDRCRRFAARGWEQDVECCAFMGIAFQFCKRKGALEMHSGSGCTVM